MREFTYNRDTKETKISISLNLDGSGQHSINTGIAFFDHMLQQISTHGLIDLQVKCEGDLKVDMHHTVEDVAIVLGQALQQAWRERGTIQRYGQRLLPMDEALILCAVDLSGRPYYIGELEFTREVIGGISTEMFEHFFYTLAMQAQITLHLKPMTFRNNHHLIEGCFKALAYALKEALVTTDGSNSTKGML